MEDKKHAFHLPFCIFNFELPPRLAVVAPAAAATAVAAAVAVTTSAPSAVAAAPAAAARPAVGLRLGLVDGEVTAVHVFAVELLDGRLCVLGRRHLDEAEAARAPGLAILYDRC